ncbi:MAG: 4Fe-4S ferredoxin [Thermoprotei archaeon]|nr:MAG: 4Fe-4S ferredoxin [Thermoprotei archaeon]
MQPKLKLMAVSVTSPHLKGKDILIYSSCLPVEHPKIFEEAAKGKTPLSICMSEEHLDKVGFKIATIISYANPSSITILTMDGSPHCTQLHTIAEQAKRITQSNIKITHLIVEKGALKEASSQAVYLSRHLSKIEELLKKQTTKKNL